MKANKEKLFLMLIIQGIITTSLILLFLSGKIIDYPRGTHEGSMTAAAGVFVIMAMTIGTTAYLVLKNQEDQKKEH